jgi:hypothetical protein
VRCAVLRCSVVRRYVYEGPKALSAGAHYAWTATERIVVMSNGTALPTISSSTTTATHTGTFATSATLPTPKDEAAAAMSSTNVSLLWNASWHSIADRVRPSGFMPTSVSGGYGGVTNQFVRDSSGQIIGLIELGPRFYPVAKAALSFMLEQLAAWCVMDNPTLGSQ